MKKSPRMLIKLMMGTRLNSLKDKLSNVFYNLFRSALKREARKRKWVRRLNYINDKGQALCKLNILKP